MRQQQLHPLHLHRYRLRQALPHLRQLQSLMRPGQIQLQRACLTVYYQSLLRRFQRRAPVPWLAVSFSRSNQTEPRHQILLTLSTKN